MCSILGFCGKGGDAEALSAALLKTKSRGPDASRLLDVGGGFLGFNRLSIMGLTASGMQPFAFGGQATLPLSGSSADGVLRLPENSRLALVCNGELYGFRPMKEALKKKGYRFFSDSDCEILPALYLEYGTEMFAMLDAEFALVLYDAQEDTFIAARDPIGIRPLYYCVNREGAYIFASEPKNLTGFSAVMQKVARRHGMVCLLHEKPFAGVNGSGKHNNWSMATDAGVNLLSPGETPHENAQFLLFLCAVIQAVDDYADLLRLSVATAGNDHRLGANEAPPAIISVFLGDELTAILNAIKTDSPYQGTENVIMKLGVHSLPRFSRDNTDRNRTSPFAFTGNKFEFRSLGSSNSIACCNIMLNAAVAESLKQYADRLEKSADFESGLHELIKEVIAKHERILFNGNGYGEEWVKEATEVRGLPNLKTTADAMPHLLDQKNMDMLMSHKVFTESELRSRCEIMLENYCKSVNIEGHTMADMVRKNYLPAIEGYLFRLAKGISVMRSVNDKLRGGSCGAAPFFRLPVNIIRLVTSVPAGKRAFPAECSRRPTARSAQ